MGQIIAGQWIPGNIPAGAFNPADAPSPKGWKARSEAATAKREARMAEVAMRSKFHNALTDRDRARTALQEAVERRDALVRNRDAKEGLLDVYKRDALQMGRVHPNQMQTAYAIEAAGPIIDAAEGRITELQTALDAAQARYDKVLAEAATAEQEGNA